MAETAPTDSDLIRMPIALRGDQLRALEEIARNSGQELDAVVRQHLDAVMPALDNQHPAPTWRATLAETEGAFADDTDFEVRVGSARDRLKTRMPAAWPES